MKHVTRSNTSRCIQNTLPPTHLGKNGKTEKPIENRRTRSCSVAPSGQALGTAASTELLRGAGAGGLGDARRDQAGLLGWRSGVFPS